MAQRYERASNWFHVAIFVVVCALASFNIWNGAGILNTRAGGDSPFLLIRVHQLAENLRHGIFPARWMPDAAFGLGYPFFNYYASLPYYLAALLNLVGVDILASLKLTQTLGMFAAAFAMFAFARSFFSRAGATLAAVAYTLAPFHLVNVYVRGDSLSEFWAFVWFPLILREMWVVCSAPSQQRASCIRLTMWLAALVLTHNVSALLFVPFIVIWAIVSLLRSRSGFRLDRFIRNAMPLVLSALLALSLSAWFWLPALGESSLVQLQEQTTGYFNYTNHFRGVDLVQSNFLFEYRHEDATRAFAMSLPQLILALFGALRLCRERLVRSRTALNSPTPRTKIAESKIDFLLILGLAILSTFMISPLSSFVWQIAKPIQLAQFPWRFLSIQSIFVSLLIGAVIDNYRSASRSRIVFALSVVALAMSSILNLPNARLHIAPEDVNTKNIQIYEWYSGNIGTTIRAEYLPKTTLPRPLAGFVLLGETPRALIAQDSPSDEVLSSQLVSRKPNEQMWRIQIDSDSLRIALPLLYSPTWKAKNTSTGQEIFISPYEGSGWISMVLPRGEQLITLYAAGTSIQSVGNWTSLVGLIVFAVVSIVSTPRVNVKRVLIVSFVGLAIIWMTRMIGMADTVLDSPSLPSRIDFAQRPFPNRDSIQFVDAASSNTNVAYELLEASITPNELQAGESFTLSLKWKDDRAPQSITVTQELPSGGEFIQLFRYARSQTRADPRVSSHVVLSNALRGPFLVVVQASEQGRVALPRSSDGKLIQSTIAGKPQPAITLLGPIVVNTPKNVSSTSIARFKNGIVLREFDWLMPDPEHVCFRPQWSYAIGLRNRADALQVSFKLIGEDGRLVAQADAQPQGGLAPTWSWQEGALIYDSNCVAVNDPRATLKPSENYVIDVSWYRLANLDVTGKEILRGRFDANASLQIPDR